MLIDSNKILLQREITSESNLKGWPLGQMTQMLLRLQGEGLHLITKLQPSRMKTDVQYYLCWETTKYSIVKFSLYITNYFNVGPTCSAMTCMGM